MPTVLASSPIKSPKTASSIVFSRSDRTFTQSKTSQARNLNFAAFTSSYRLLKPAVTVIRLHSKFTSINSISYSRSLNIVKLTLLSSGFRSALVPRLGYTVAKLGRLINASPLPRVFTLPLGSSGKGSKRPVTGQIFPRGYR